MASLRSQIVAAKFAALGGGGKPAGLTVARGRVDPFAPEELPAMNVRPANEKPLGPPVRGYVARKGFVLAVDVFAAGEPFDAVLDDYLAWAIAAVMADPLTAGLSVGIVEAQTDYFEPRALGTSYGGATVYFQIDYVQAAANASAHA